MTSKTARNSTSTSTEGKEIRTKKAQWWWWSYSPVFSWSSGHGRRPRRSRRAVLLVVVAERTVRYWWPPRPPPHDVKCSPRPAEPRPQLLRVGGGYWLPLWLRPPPLQNNRRPIVRMNRIRVWYVLYVLYSYVCICVYVYFRTRYSIDPQLLDRTVPLNRSFLVSAYYWDAIILPCTNDIYIYTF